jgi:hypothetical protein
MDTHPFFNQQALSSKIKLIEKHATKANEDWVVAVESAYQSPPYLLPADKILLWLVVNHAVFFLCRLIALVKVLPWIWPCV